MKKKARILAVLVLLGLGFGRTATAADAGAAAILSVVMPGTGEWYNSAWRGSFPWAECVLGHICPCVMLSSVIDAANGNSKESLRIDFWTEPSN